MPAPNLGAAIGCAARLRPDGATLLLAAASLIGAGLILAREVNYGVGTTLDSVAYISAARNAADGNGFVVLHDQSHFVNYPPLFPMLLALADLLGVDPLRAAGYLNAASYGAAVFIASAWLRRRVRSALLVAWATVALIVAPPLVQAASLAGSEAVFIPLTLAGLLSLIAYLNGEPKRSLLIVAASFAGLALLTRWFGAPLALTGVLLLLLQRDSALPQRAVNILLYLTIAMTPICLWLARNLLQIGSLSNHGDIPPAFSFTENLSTLMLRFAEALSGWSQLGRAAYFRLTDYADGAGATATLIAAGLLLAIGVAAALFVLLKGKPYLRWRLRRSDPAFILALFVIVYAVSVVAMISYRGVESFVVRYYAPIHIPLLLLAAFLLDRLFTAWRNRRPSPPVGAGPTEARARAAVAAAAAAALILWLLPQANLYAVGFQERLREGLGITSRSWRESDLIRRLQENPPQGEYELASNIRGEVYLLVGLPAPHHRIPCDADRMRELADWMHDIDKDLYVIWSDRGASCMTPDEVRAALAQDAVDVETTADLADGTILVARDPG